MGAEIKHFTLEQKDDNTYGWPEERQTYFSSESLLNRTNRISLWSGITTILSNAEDLITAECRRR